MKSMKQIESFLDKFDSEKSEYTAMTYEQGVEEALLWVLGEISDEEFSPIHQS